MRPTFGTDGFWALAVPATDEVPAKTDTEKEALLAAHETRPPKPNRWEWRATPGDGQWCLDVKSLARRAGRIEERDWLLEAGLGPSRLIVMPKDLPEEDCRAYDALPERGEFMAWAVLLEKHAGQRPGPRTRVIALRLRPDGPR